jgi:hypothetical protein
MNDLKKLAAWLETLAIGALGDTQGGDRGFDGRL